MILPLYALAREARPHAARGGGRPRGRARRTFSRVSVPLTMPGIVAGIVLVFIPRSGSSSSPTSWAARRRSLLGNLIQNQFAVARDKPFGAALAFELIAAVLLLLVAYASTHGSGARRCARARGRRLRRDPPPGCPSGARRAAPLSRAQPFGWSAGCWRSTLARSTLPLRADPRAGGLLLQRRARQTAVLGGLHPRLVRAPGGNAQVLRSVRNSLVVATLTTLVATVAGRRWRSPSPATTPARPARRRRCSTCRWSSRRSCWARRC